MNFGLEGIVGFALYGAFVLAFLLSIFWRPISGLYFLTPLIPLQTIRDRLSEFPLGGSVVILSLLGVAIGLRRRGQPLFDKTPWNTVLCIYSVYIFVSLIAGSFYLDSPLSFSPDNQRFAAWKDYMVMPLLLVLASGAAVTKRDVNTLLLLMIVGIFLLDKGAWGAVSDRDYSSYSDDLRDPGPMGYAGANGLAAFLAQASVFMFALAAFERRHLLRWAYYALAVFSAMCLMYSLSRGGYLAFLTGALFVGVIKERKLLVVLAAFGLVWASVVPEAVRTRVTMTQNEEGDLDHSSETRVALWEDAMELIKANPVFGTGFNTYAQMGRVGRYRDTHNIYLKVLAETGAVGLLIFLWFLGRTFITGFRLFRRAQDPLFAALGLGLAAWMVSAATANLFGDRWFFLQVQGYLWLTAGLVGRGLALELDAAAQNDEEGSAESRLQPAGYAAAV